jgi:hypothetical protein
VRGQQQQFHRDPFEGRGVSWRKGASNATHEELAHEMTAKEFHTGQQAEHIQLRAEQGTFIHYTYTLGKVQPIDELAISLWLKANRPGSQLLARLVLPREKDPQNLDQPVTALIRGDPRDATYENVSRWQRLELRQVAKLIKQQQPLLRAELKRDLNFDGAYIDQLVLNVYGGRGQSDIWIDDLEVGPIFGDVFQPVNNQGAAHTTASTNRNVTARPPIKVVLNQDRLSVDGRPTFLRAIRYNGTPLQTLRDAGFNAVHLDHGVPERVIEEVADMGFYLVPEIVVLEDSPRVALPTGLTREVARFPRKESVLFWHVGSGLTREQAAYVGKAAQTIRAADGKPIAGDIWDGYAPYCRNLEMLGTHRWPLFTGLEMAAYRDWLAQRGRLAEPGVYLWTWVQTHLPRWYSNLVYDGQEAPADGEPFGPQPEQIRLLAFTAISAGYRGIGYWADAALANPQTARDRLLAMALLNHELAVLEPMLATMQDVTWAPTKHGDVKASVMRFKGGRGGVLCFLTWLGPGAQFVPGQVASMNLELVVPGAPEDAQVWEIAPGYMRPVKHERAAGGIKVQVADFGLTSVLLFTSDVERIGELQLATRRNAVRAAQWSYDLAIEQLKKAEAVNAQLEELGQPLSDGRTLLAEARKLLIAARAALNRGTQSDFPTAYEQSHRAMRVLRILMRAHWEKAVKLIDNPVCTPYSVSFYTLPRYYQFVEQIRNARPSSNLLTHGNFELEPGQSPDAWTLQTETLDAVVLSAERVSDQPKEGKRCLKLEVRPKDPKAVPQALERTFLAINSPVHRLQPGSLVRVSGWVRIPQPIQASADGALFFDSIGGEPLAIRLNSPTPWRKFTLFRRVPPSGTVHVSMALSGIGTVFFDDIRVEPMFPAGQATE